MTEGRAPTRPRTFTDNGRTKILAPVKLTFCGRRDGLRPVFGVGLDDTEVVPPLPAELVDLALVRPILGLHHEPSTDRILHNVRPFIVIAFAATKLSIPKMPLPNR